MGFTIEFIVELSYLIFLCLPMFIVFTAAIGGLSLWIGKQEGWRFSDSIYFGFITATTVGYGDFHPQKDKSKYVAISISILGLIMTGVLVALAVEAVGVAVDAQELIVSAE